jgi:hypothetical protein
MPIMSTRATYGFLDWYSNYWAVQPVSIDVAMASDTMLVSSAATTNYNTDTSMSIGESNAAVSTRRGLVKPNWASIPAGKRIVSATLKLVPITDTSSNARTMYAHRVLRNVNFGQCTWNVFSTGNNWGTAGCSNSTTDYDGAVALGSMAVPASPTLNAQMSMTLLAAEIQKFYDGTYSDYGIVLFVDTQSDDMIVYATTDHATAAYRPILTVEYIP